MGTVPAEIGGLGEDRLRRFRLDDLDQLMDVLVASQVELGQWLPGFVSGVSREGEQATMPAIDAAS